MTDRPIRAAILCDPLEESWLSMDLTGEMILDHFAARPGGDVAATRVRPRWRHRAARLSGSAAAWNADRILNRLIDYPNTLKRLVKRSDFDLYHIIDHGYAQLVHALPAERAVVTCHDLEAFRCLLNPAAEPRPKWFRAMVRHCLRGMQKAAAVVCDSRATRDAILAHGLLPAERLHVVYLAVHPECAPEPSAKFDAEADRLLGGPRPGDSAPELLHVGSNIPRKRIDVVLETFAAVRRAIPEARLIKVGAVLSGAHEARARELGIAEAIMTIPYFDPKDPAERATLAAIYRRARLTLFPSDAEGFGLPVPESMACGTPVLLSDIPVLREVGGPCARYAPVGDVPAWTAQALEVLASPPSPEDRAAALAWASRFHWATHVDQLAGIYRSLRRGETRGVEGVVSRTPGASGVL
jgi:glycosyltransferase involved in cell wall biosynthesis